jgi:CRP-like cAMP-binding protein
MHRVKELLSKSKYFGPDLDMQIDEIVRSGRLKRAEAGSFLINEGTKDDRLFLNLSGIIKVFKTSIDGRELILYFAKAGESVNDLWLMNNQVSIASAQAIGPVEYFVVDRRNLEAIIRKYPDTGLRIISELCRRVCVVIDVLGDSIFKKVLNRLSKLLLDIAQGKEGDGKAISQQDMAGILGTVREVVSRSLKELKERGIIGVRQNRIVILDVNALRALAEGGIY